MIKVQLSYADPHVEHVEIVRINDNEVRPAEALADEADALAAGVTAAFRRMVTRREEAGS